MEKQPRVVHRLSLSRLPSTAKKSKNVGRPSMKEFDASQERKLFRLVAKANIPWKYIKAAMYEPATNDRAEFAPSKETCRKYWNKITGSNPDEARIKNESKRKEQRKQLDRAYLQYQSRQDQTSQIPIIDSSTDDQVIVSPSVPVTQEPSRSTNECATTIGPHQRTEQHIRAAIPSISTVPSLLDDGTTPAESIRSVQTPISQYDSSLDRGQIDSSEGPEITLSEFLNMEGMDIHPSSSRRLKRALPADFEMSLPRTRPPTMNRPARTSIDQESSWNATNQIPPSSSGGHSEKIPVSNTITTKFKTLPKVPEERTGPVPKKSKKASKIPMTPEDVEDMLGFRRGLIDFVKYGLTWSRNSVQSMRSSKGGLRSRFSLQRRSSYTDDAYVDNDDLLTYTNQSSEIDRSELILAGSSSEAPNGRAETSIFQELSLGGFDNNQISESIKRLLDVYRENHGNDNTIRLVRARNPARQTALELALRYGNVPARTLLLDAGADVYAKTSDGKTLSAFGKEAQNRAIEDGMSNTPYFNIGICRNKILNHSSQGIKHIKPETSIPKPSSEAIANPEGRPWDDMGNRDWPVASSESQYPFIDEAGPIKINIIESANGFHAAQSGGAMVFPHLEAPGFIDIGYGQAVRSSSSLYPQVQAPTPSTVHELVRFFEERQSHNLSIINPNVHSIAPYMDDQTPPPALPTLSETACGIQDGDLEVLESEFTASAQILSFDQTSNIASMTNTEFTNAQNLYESRFGAVGFFSEPEPAPYCESAGYVGMVDMNIPDNNVYYWDSC